MSRPKLVQIDLTKDEADLIGWFRQMGTRFQGETLVIAKGDAEIYQAEIKKQPKPGTSRGIRLVASFGKVVTA